MSFTDSLDQFTFLSELYERDAPSAVLMTEYPSSNSVETRFQNTERFIIHDPYPPPPVALLKTLGPHHLMYGWGDKIPVTSEVEPSALLIEHWRRGFGDAGCPAWRAVNERDAYITSFPFETLDVVQQVIDPAVLYHLHSKEAIEDIDCPQAAVLDAVEFPCIMKLSHGYAGLGNFIIHNAEDLRQAQNQIDKQWPDAPIVINKLLTDIIGDYGVQFYLGRDGEITWLGFTEQLFNDTNRWIGGVFRADLQDELYPEFIKIAEPVAGYLHEKGYFGVVGIDILHNKNDQFFLVDLNPRLTGITPFLMTSRLLVKDGYSTGIYAASVSLPGDLDCIIERAEQCETGKVFILSAYQVSNSQSTICHISVNGKSVEECEHLLSTLKIQT